MGRTKWNKLTDEKKAEISSEIVVFMDEVTKKKDKFTQEFDFFDAINDEIKSLFECNGDCSTCSVEDVKHCLQNFRVANVYLVKKLKLYDQGLEKFMEGMEIWCKTFLKWLKADSDIEEEIEKTEEVKEVDYFA